MTRRLEITVSDGVWGALELARGHEPRASFVKRALEAALAVDAGMSPVLKAKLREVWDSPELEAQLVERALESALSETRGPLANEQAGPGPVASVDAVRPAAPSRASSSGVGNETAVAMVPRVVAPAGSSPARSPRSVPGVMSARDLMEAKQRQMNADRGRKAKKP